MNFLSVIKQRLKRERDVFLKLNLQARLLLYSAVIYGAIYPLLGIFTNTFIFRQTTGFLPIASYNIGIFISLASFFYLNGLLLKKNSIKKLFSLGILGQGLATSLVFITPNLNSGSLFFFGFLYGIPFAFYWANRNFLSVELTKTCNRD